MPTRRLIGVFVFVMSVLATACGGSSATTDGATADRDAAILDLDTSSLTDSASEPDAGTSNCGSPFCPVASFGDSVSYTGVWGAAADAIWVVGSNATIRFFDGERWIAQPSGTEYWELTAVHGTAPDDVWAVGFSGTVLHFDGHSWSPLDAGVTSDLHGVVALARNDVWIVGDNGFRGGLAVHWNGTSFTNDSPSRAHLLRRVAGSGTRVVTFDDQGVYEWNGAWNATETRSGIQDIAAVGDDTFVLTTFIAGSGYAVLGGEQMFTGDPVLIGQPMALDVRASNRIAVVGPQGRIEELDGTTERRRVRTPHQLVDAWISPDGTVWAVGEAGTVVHAGADDIRTVDAGDLHSMLGVHAVAHDDVWVVGPAGRVAHYDGASWSLLPSGTDVDLQSVTASDDGSIWAVGEAGVAVRFVGATAEHHDLGIGADLRAIVADEGGAMWAAGSVLYRWDGAMWTEVAPLTHLANDAWSPNAGEIWVAQQEGRVSHFIDGVLDTTVGDPSTGEAVMSIAGIDGLVWIGLADGSMRQWSAGTWIGVDVPSAGFDSGARGIFAHSTSDVLAVGREIVHYDGSQWTSVSAMRGLFQDVHGIGSERWIVGWHDAFLYGSL